MRQGVCDVRRAAVWLPARPDVDPSGIGVAGISLGGIVSSLAAAVDPAIREGAFLLAGGDLASILWEMPEAAPYRKQWIESGRTKQDLKTLTDPFDPLTYAPGLKGKRLMMIAGKVDEVVPPASTLLSGRLRAGPRFIGATAAITRRSAIFCPASAKLSNSSRPREDREYAVSIVRNRGSG